MAFEKEIRELRRAVLGARGLSDEVAERIAHLRQALVDTPAVGVALMAELEELKDRNDAIRLALVGNPTKDERNVFTPPAIQDRVERMAYDLWFHTQPPTETHRKAYRWAADAFAEELAAVESLVADLESLEAKAEAAGAPWTPGRMPIWKQ